MQETPLVPFAPAVKPRDVRLAMPKRLYALDAVRGVAALSVVLWHWQHFFYLGAIPPALWRPFQPFYEYLWPFYDAGYLAVDLFFGLSGFIFYWLYADAIHERRVRFKVFCTLRLSRLYPLHLATLLIVAAGQLAFMRWTNTYAVYGTNDLWHFVLNLAFVPAWGFESGVSFNGPVWSVSIEILLYLLFFSASRWLPVKTPILLAMVACGIWLAPLYNANIARGVTAFFLGGFVFFLCRQALAKLGPRTLAALAFTTSLLACAAWMLALATLRSRIDPVRMLIETLPGLADPQGLPRRALLQAKALWTVCVMFPLTILALSLSQACLPNLGKRLAWLGDLSYSSYLLHFPLQLLFIALAKQAGLDRWAFFLPNSLLVFMAVLMPLSWLSYRYFELPLQRLWRARSDATRPKRDFLTVPSLDSAGTVDGSPTHAQIDA